MGDAAFWYNSLNMRKTTNFYLRNVYMKTDVGIITNEEVIDRAI